MTSLGKSVRLIVIIVTKLNKPISYPTIKSFVYLDIDFHETKATLPDKSGHVPQPLSGSLRATTLARPCGTGEQKKVYRCPDECSVRASPRFPNVNLYSVKREKENGGQGEEEGGEEERKRAHGGTTMQRHKVSQDARESLQTGDKNL